MQCSAKLVGSGAPLIPGCTRPPLTRRRLLMAAVCSLVAGAALAESPALLLFDQFYKSFGIRGYELSDRLRSLAGHEILIRGYMAPPLKAESRFFVLTREPMALCPFCQSDADWPVDIVVVYLKGASPLVSGGEAVFVRGRLAVGSWTDPENGFVSQIRIVDAAFRRA
jgi:hypothetical protein